MSNGDKTEENSGNLPGRQRGRSPDYQELSGEQRHTVPLQANPAPSVHAFAIDGMGEVVILVWEDTAEKARELIREEEDA